MRLVCVALLTTFCISFFSGCGQTAEAPQNDFFEFTSYRDIPGVTEEEIDAIENLRNNVDYFVYGMNPSTEAFYNENGEIRGYSALFSTWLTELFGIPFIPKIFEWGDLIAGLEDGSVDFTGELTATEERRNIFYMTDAIAERSVKYMRLADSPSFAEIQEFRMLRFAFLEGTTTVVDVTSLSLDPFETFYVEDYNTAYTMLKSGEIDAFFDEGIAEAAFDIFGDVVAHNFFPLIYSPVSLSTQNSELAPIISVVQKSLENGSLRFLTELYYQGQNEYLRHKMFLQLTPEEIAFIRENPVVNFAAEYDNYPISFFDSRSGEWQGIAFDVIDKLEELTGLTFKIVNDENTEWPDLLDMLESGEAAMISELIPNKEREGLFLWPETPVLTDYFALISKSDYRNISINEIWYIKVGVAKGTVYAEKFKNWFPNHMNIIEYESSDDAFNALDRREVDAVMSSECRLLALTNHNEFAGYKINFIVANRVLSE
jgi:ABC-type amino acid transport substrate-binding protein